MPHRRFVRVLLAGAAILLAVTPGRAQGPAPAAPSTVSRPRRPIRAVPGRVRVSRVAFTGVSPSILSELRTTLSMRASSRWPWGRKVYFSRARLADDLRRIEAYYDEHGFPDARVDTYDVDMPSPTEAAITFHVVEGTPVHIASVQTFGLEVLPEVVRARVHERARADAGRRPDPRRRRPRARAGPHRAPGGRPPVRARRRSSRPRPPNGQDVVLTVAAEPGPTAVFGPLTITGESSVGEEVIRRQLAFGPGDPFKRSRIVESQRRLYGLELFDFVNIDVPSLQAQPTEVPVRLSVTEGRHHRAEGRGRLRDRGAGPHRRQPDQRQLPGRRPHRVDRGQVVVARSRRQGQPRHPVLVLEQLPGRHPGAAVGRARARLPAADARRARHRRAPADAPRLVRPAQVGDAGRRHVRRRVRAVLHRSACPGRPRVPRRPHRARPRSRNRHGRRDAGRARDRRDPRHRRQPARRPAWLPRVAAPRAGEPRSWAATGPTSRRPPTGASTCRSAAPWSR